SSTAASQPQVVPVNQNIAVAARNFGQRKRLRPEQITELEVFVNDSNLLHEAKLMANVLAVGNQLKEIVAAQPTFKISDALETNIQKYAPAVLLSSKIKEYKGEGPTNNLLAILKKYPDWDKIVAAVQDALTQRRSTIKKAILCSLKTHKTDTKYVPNAQHQNIFELAQAVVKGTECTINVILCARVSLMRSVFLKHPGPKFWDKIDERLDKIHKEAKGDANKITKAFRHVLTIDQDTHSIKDYELDDRAVDDFQQTVDDVLDVHAANAATSATFAASATSASTTPAASTTATPATS
ncbi:hypothetical protein C8J57DRAFT_1387612, partial [Mycena rebaudengoi]